MKVCTSIILVHFENIFFYNLLKIKGMLFKIIVCAFQISYVQFARSTC